MAKAHRIPSPKVRRYKRLLLINYGTNCFFCERPLTFDIPDPARPASSYWTLDHIYPKNHPLRKVFGNRNSALLLACYSCNQERKNTYMENYFHSCKDKRKANTIMEQSNPQQRERSAESIFKRQKFLCGKNNKTVELLRSLGYSEEAQFLSALVLSHYSASDKLRHLMQEKKANHDNSCHRTDRPENSHLPVE